MNLQAPPGVFDILPVVKNEPFRSSFLWNYVEGIIRKTAHQYGFREIRTPLFEKTELFQRSVGDTSDIVSKEIYTFEDRGGRKLCLRPEGTASVARAYIEHNLGHESPLHKFFYIGPMFRYERQQAGRYRQHHQFGVEAMGSGSPEQDAEIIDLFYTVVSRLGLKNLNVKINSLGNKEAREAFRTALINYLTPFTEKLSDDSKKRLSVNPLRILDSKDPNDQEILKKAPSILDFLTPEDKKHFDTVLELLSELKIPYQVEPKIVRGLDYYNRTVFEITSGELGSQNSIGGGGRYDELLSMIGGQMVPSCGFGMGLERLIQLMLIQNVDLPEPHCPVLFFIPLGEKAKIACFRIMHDLRAEGIPVEMDFSGRKLGKVMAYADQIGATYVAVVGDKEIETQSVELKEMSSGEKLQAPLHHLARILNIEIHAEEFYRVYNAMNIPFDDSSEVDYFVKKISKSISSTRIVTQGLQNAVEKIKEIL